MEKEIEELVHKHELEEAGFEVKSIDLDMTNFFSLVMDFESRIITTENPWFIKFFAPWCPHCQHMADEWEQLHEKHMDHLNVGSVDCTTDAGKGLCKAFNIRGFPTLIYFPKDVKEFHTFSGRDRTLEEFEKFAVDGEWRDSSATETGAPPKSLYEEYVKPSADALMQKLADSISDSFLQ